MLRIKAKLIEVELQHRFNSNIINNFENDYPSLKDNLSKKCIDYNAKLTTIGFNLKFLSGKSNDVSVDIKKITNACSDCRYAINSLKIAGKILAVIRELDLNSM